MKLKKLWKIFLILKSFESGKETPTVEKLLYKLEEKFGENAEEIFKELCLTGIIKLDIDKDYNLVWSLTDRGAKKYAFVKYIFSPDKNQEKRKRENNEILNSLLKIYF